MKTCAKCKEEKSLEMFSKDKSRKDGLQRCCKACMSNITKAWQQANPDKALAHTVAWQKANQDKVTATKRDWYQANTEKAKADVKAWKQNNRDKMAAQSKAYLQRLNLVNTKISRRTLAAWAAQVKALNPRCDWCLCVDDLEAHHILPKAMYPELALDISNGQTLCIKHHDEIHSLNLHSTVLPRGF